MRGSSWLMVFTGFALLTLALMPPGNVSSDGASMLEVGRSLASGDGFAVPCEFGIAGRNGQCFSTYYPLLSMLAVPFIAIGGALAAVASTPTDYVEGFAAQAVPALAAAGVAGLTAYFSLLLGATRARALLAALTVIFASEIAIYYRSFFAETLASLLVCLMVWAFLRDDRWRLLAPASIVGLILTKPQLVLVGLVVGASFALMQRRRRPAIEAVGATAVGTIVYAGYNLLRFSDVTNFGGEARTYDPSSFAPEALLEALGLLLISPGRGWLVYSPIVILGVYGAWKLRRQQLAMVAMVVLVASLVPYLANPGGGFNWGSRYLVPAIPLFVALAWAVPTRRWLAPTLACLGVIIALPTFAGFYQRSYAELAARGGDASDAYWSVSEAPLITVWSSTGHQIEAARQTDVRRLVQAPESAPGSTATVDGQQFFSVVAQWWWMTPAAKVPRPAGLLVALIMLAGGGFLLRRGMRPASMSAATGRARD